MALIPLILLATFLILAATSHAAHLAAAAPSSGPPDVTAILEKGQRYTTLLRLLKDTHIVEQIQSQLDHSSDGLTLLAPTDDAFRSLKPGTLNGLASQEQVSLVLFHVLPKYYTPATFETASNPVRTQASGNKGAYALNVTSTATATATAGQVNVSTGVDETQLGDALYAEFPLAVFSVDKVLLPYDLFGPKPPAAAPEPGEEKGAPGKKKAPADAPSSEVVASPSAASVVGRRVGRSLVVGAALMVLGVGMVVF